MINHIRFEIELLSDAIFGTGQSIPGDVDLEIVHDEYGFPYMKGKTFKGNLRKKTEELAEILKNFHNTDFSEHIDNMFGTPNMGINSCQGLRFSNCELSDNVRNFFIAIIKNKREEITPQEVTKALTEYRYFTSIDEDGSYKDKSLRTFRVIKKGLIFYVDINKSIELTDIELALLSGGIRFMKNLGTMKSRGKGEIVGRLLIKENGKYKDKTDYYIDCLMGEVK